MVFYTLDFEAAESLFLGQLDPNCVESVYMCRGGVRDEEFSSMSTLTRFKAPTGTSDSVAVRDLLSKAGDNFNLILESKQPSVLVLGRIEVLKSSQLCDGGKSQEYAVIVDYAFPEEKTIKSF